LSFILIVVALLLLSSSSSSLSSIIIIISTIITITILVSGYSVFLFPADVMMIDNCW